MGNLFLASTITLGAIFSMVAVILFLVFGFAGSTDTTILIFTVIGLNIISWILSPMLMDIINYFLFKQHPIDKPELKEKYPYIHSLIEDVSTEYGFNFPKFFIIEDLNPTAFTYGSGRFNARIVISRGIFKYLNEKEIKAVIAHELGHIVNRDFVVMMIATTLIEILYVIYDSFTRSTREIRTSNSNNKENGSLIGIGILSYIFYLIGIYLILYLSRTREYLADRFAAAKTDGEDLANALIKLAYGIVIEDDKESSKRLLGATRALGLIDPENSKQLGTISYVTQNNKNIISEVMVYDVVSPWAFISEINSTHPLTGKRILALSGLNENKKNFGYDINSAIQRLNVDYNKINSTFALEFLIYTLPIIGFILGLIFGLFWNVNPLSFILIFSGLGILIQIIYKFGNTKFEKRTILECMRNVYVSPIKGEPVILEGNIIGKGISGSVISEDMMLQDKTGLIFLDFAGTIPVISNLIFGISKIQKILGKKLTATGWFFRNNYQLIFLKDLNIESDKEIIKSRGYEWSFILPIILIILGILILVF